MILECKDCGADVMPEADYDTIGADVFCACGAHWIIEYDESWDGETEEQYWFLGKPGLTTAENWLIGNSMNTTFQRQEQRERANAGKDSA